MQLNMIQSEKSGQKSFGPALALLAAFLAIEALFSFTGIAVPYVEVWVVLVVVPLGFAFIQQSKRQRPIAIAKKVCEFDEDDNVAPRSMSKQLCQQTNSHSQVRDTSGHSRPRGEKLVKFADASKAAERTDEKARIEACVKSKDFTGAQACLTKLSEKGNADAVCYNMVISLCGKAGKVKQAHEWMQHMLDAGVRPDVASFNSVIDACARCGDMKGAEHWLKRMDASGTSANTITYNALINACAQASDIPRAQWWMSQLCKNSTPDVVSYTSVINACAKQGDVHSAEGWLRKMIQAGVEANVVSYSTVINACARKGNKVSAEMWLAKMVEGGVPADTICYNSVIDACAKARDANGAERWIALMLKNGIEATTVTYNAMINACARQRIHRGLRSGSQRCSLLASRLMLLATVQ